MEKIFRKLIEDNFSELAGARVDASIPVPEHLINELIAVSLEGNKSITYCRVSIGGQNRVSVTLKTPLWPWPLHLQLKLFHSVDLAGSPKIRAFLENNVFLGKLGAFFKALPAWIKMYQDQVIIDLGQFVQAPEQEKMLERVRSVELTTEPAKIIFDIKIEVD